MQRCLRARLHSKAVNLAISKQIWAGRVPKRAPEEISLPATARVKIIAQLDAVRTDVKVNDERLALGAICAVTDERRIYERVYDLLT